MRSGSGLTADAVLHRALVERVNAEAAAVCRERGRDRLNLMEVCGTHTMAISSSGIRSAVGEHLRLISGPGCPVCVTAQSEVDAALALAGRKETTIVTFGDMLRVPGSTGSLEQSRARGADVRVVYSAADAVELAGTDPGRQFVFLGVGFETTAPTVAAAVEQARDRGVGNLAVLAMFKLVPPALRAIASAGRVNIDGLILPGHVSTVIGAAPYRFLAEEFRMPCCITGFEPADVLQGILLLLEQVQGGPAVAIQYRRAVRPEGNPAARAMIEQVFEPAAAEWRGLGTIAGSGLRFRDGYRQFDAGRQFRLRRARPKPTACRCGDIMLGLIIPPECRLFDRGCTPETPVGPCMVSSEGACAAYYKYDRVHAN